MADILLDAEMKLGGILEAIPPQYAMGSVDGTNRPHRKASLPPEVTKKASHQAQTLSKNAAVVEQVKARDKGGG